MVPNILPIGATLAFMGFAGIHLDMSNLLVASIGISIAVDDTIHFLHQFQAHYDAYGNVDRAIANSFKRAGHAMVHTSMILFAGFLVFLAGTLRNFQEFGLLIAITVVLALFIDLMFTPALIRTFFKDREIARGRLA
jgi:predicted RND superfamily exporter protein